MGSIYISIGWRNIDIDRYKRKKEREIENGGYYVFRL